MPRLALFQLLDVLFLQRKAFEIGELWRIAEFLDGQIVGNLAKRVDVRCEFEIARRCGVHVDGTKNIHFIWRWRIQYLGYRFSASNTVDLLVVQPDILSKEFERFGVLSARSEGGRREDSRQKHSCRSDSGSPMCLHNFSKNCEAHGALLSPWATLRPNLYHDQSLRHN